MSNVHEAIDEPCSRRRRSARRPRPRGAARLRTLRRRSRSTPRSSAAGWAIIEPTRNRALAELAVADTGIGNVEDKIRKNHRKTLGLLRDLQGATSVGVIAGGSRARHRRDRAAGRRGLRRHAVDQSRARRRPTRSSTRSRAATRSSSRPRRRAGSTCARLIEFIHAQLRPHRRAARPGADAAGAGHQAGDARAHAPCDLVVATGSQANVRAAYASGTPAFGVGAGNVAGIVDETRRRRAPRRERIVPLEDLRQRDQLLVGEQPGDRRCGRARPCSRRSRRAARVLLDAEQKATLAGADVARRQALGRGDRPVGARDRRARGGAGPAPIAPPGARSPRAIRAPDGRGGRRRPRPSVFRREALARC